ncbi:MAG TPA: type II secretion system protein GspC [Candidatus Binataceae bacterium]|nr:type II secretion system protein GspC [Candidatus Binataceae bacterium]
MSGFNLLERYVLLINLLIGVVIIPYFLALGVTDAAKLYLARNIVPAEMRSRNDSAQSAATAVRGRAAYAAIERRDIFNLAPPPVDAAVENEPLTVKLVGTSQLSSGKPYAIIQNASAEQSVYRVGEMIPDAGQLLEVTANRAVIMHNGHRAAIEIPHDAAGSAQPFAQQPGAFRGAPPVSPGMPLNLRRHAAGVRRLSANRFLLDRSTVSSNLQNMAPLFSQIRAIPNVQNGAANGFRLSEIQPNSIFQQIGLQDGDLLRAINGQPVGDPTKALAMMQSLQNQSSITLSVVRNGSLTQLHYTVR